MLSDKFVDFILSHYMQCVEFSFAELPGSTPIDQLT